MEQLFSSSIQNFNFVELLCFFIISKGLTKMEAINDTLKNLNVSIKNLEKRIENIERKIEDRLEKNS